MSKSIWTHYKGNKYKMVGESTHTETGEKLVNYKDSDGKLWSRPYDMFHGWLEVNNKIVKRFTENKKG